MQRLDRPLLRRGGGGIHRLRRFLLFEQGFDFVKFIERGLLGGLCGLKLAAGQVGFRCRHILAGIDQQLGRFAVLLGDIRAERIGGHLGHDLRSGRVGKVAVAGEDPLLYRPRSPGVFLKKGLVVVRLDQEGVDPPDRFHDLAGGVAEVGEHGEAGPVGPQNKSDRVGRIVRDRKRQHLDAPQHKPRAARKQIPPRPDPLPLEMVGGERVGEHRNAVFPHKNFQPLRVVAVLVGEKDAGERSRSDPASLQPGTQPARAQARIHQHGAVPGTHQ